MVVQHNDFSTLRWCESDMRNKLHELLDPFNIKEALLFNGLAQLQANVL